MWRGIAVTTLALSVLYVISQRGASDRVAEGGGLLVAGMRRFLSPQVAGIGDHSKGTTSTDRLHPAAAAATGGGGFPKFT
jgi:hypothetical protein